MVVFEVEEEEAAIKLDLAVGFDAVFPVGPAVVCPAAVSPFEEDPRAVEVCETESGLEIELALLCLPDPDSVCTTGDVDVDIDDDEHDNDDDAADPDGRPSNSRTDPAK